MRIVRAVLSMLGKRSWKRFNKNIATGRRPLLQELRRFPDAVLVAGCQRSGTTAVTRVLTNSPGFTNFRITQDNELDAALILSGEIQYAEPGRHCFQTTYLNDSYREYLTSGSTFQLIWILRNPLSVVYSMLYHWRVFALEDLYRRCGAPVAKPYFLRTAQGVTREGPSQLEKACFSYVGKSIQVRDLASSLPKHRLMIIDYDELCLAPDMILPNVFQFVGVEFNLGYADSLNSSSLNKASHLTTAEESLVSDICVGAYDEAMSYKSVFK